MMPTYEPPLYRPPSEHDALILQATIGCSHNHCTYCAMYRHKAYRERPVEELLSELQAVAGSHAPVSKLFVADGDALGMPTETWLEILLEAKRLWPDLRRASCYATAQNVAAKTDDELQALSNAGLTLLYLGPESGDPDTLKRIAKGATYDEFVTASRRAAAAGLQRSVIMLLGAGGAARSAEHARASAALISDMDPEYVAALTLTVVAGTPLAKLEASGRFTLPEPATMLAELRTIIAEASPTDAVFRTNHASNYLPLAGRLPRDRNALLAVLDAARAGRVPLRPEQLRGL